jgi:hypothetical protein
MVDSTVKSSYKIRIRVRDGLLGTPGVHDRSTQFILTVESTISVMNNLPSEVIENLSWLNSPGAPSRKS